MVITRESSDGDIDDTSESEDLCKGVKLLSDNGLHRVPSKFILPVSDRPNINVEDQNVVTSNLIQLPIIDFAELLGPNRPQVLHSLSHACEHYGFFQLVNHGIPDDVVRRMMDVCRRFFDLAHEERARYMTTDVEAPVRYGTSYSPTRDTVFCWRDFLKLLCHPLPDFLPHWPSSPVDFQKEAATYAERTRYLFLTLVGAILESLGLGIEGPNKDETEQEEEEDILKGFQDGSQMIVANYYPPCPEPELTLGIPPHSDYGFLSLLIQGEVEGLQIQHQAQWVTIRPVPNTFVVNLGDHLEIFSNGKYKSVLHRALVNAAKSRISVVSLHSLPFTHTVRPSSKLVSETNPKLYKDTSFDDFIEYLSTKEPKRKEFLDSRKLS
ncbi:hypothetical protein K1719_006678 [Acacia pycnantha]|nr:hypothetical protein K1719_006678 [Acacia pycnantha]